MIGQIEAWERAPGSVRLLLAAHLVTVTGFLGTFRNQLNVDQPGLLVVGHRGRPIHVGVAHKVKSVSIPSAAKACAKTSEMRLCWR